MRELAEIRKISGPCSGAEKDMACESVLIIIGTFGII